VAATVPSESEFQSWTILWLNTLLRTSSLLWPMNNLSLCPLVHCPSALRKNISGSGQSNPFLILNTWIISDRPNGRATFKNNEATSKMKLPSGFSYAHAKIRTQVVVICGPTHYQLDHRGNKDNNYVFVVLLIHTLAQYMYIIINSL